METPFNEKLKQFRARIGYTQTTLADVLGLSRRTIQQYESGNTRPELDVLEKMAKLFGVSIDTLTGDSTQESKHISVFKAIASNDSFSHLDLVFSAEPAPLEWPNSTDYFGIVMQDKSMEPRFYEGDILLCKRTKDFEQNDFAVVLPRGRSAIIRRIMKTGEDLVSTPANPTYPSEVFKLSDAQVLGIVKEQRSKFK